MRPFDLQINGYRGVDLNHDSLDPEALHAACETLRRENVDGFLATVITDELDAMERRIRRVVELRERDPLARELIAGIHIEGPFLNEQCGYAGAHPPQAMRPASLDAMQRLLDAGGGYVRLITLAPERDPGLAVTSWLAAQGLCVAAGHCDPEIDLLAAAIDSGLTLFTHLGNGCPMQLHRHDNIIQRVLSLTNQLWVSFIPDGVHIPFFALKNYLKCTGIERAIFVTDAIAAAGLGPGLYTLGKQTIHIGDDLVARSPDRSHFIGSTVTWTRIRCETGPALGLTEEDMELLCCRNPRLALGLPS
ncbi:MAG TPA: N-acetylglucosamine-6-phosphate deacetylase [Verrucomicrobiales bacterium]|nr:N-acetylglucosamine-6-phosphate deacetylase [Verrucomicrobiales bacterium]